MNKVIGAAVLIFCSAASHATNPCDFDEKACEQWKAYLKAQEEFANRPRPQYAVPPRYTGKYDDCPHGKEMEGLAIEALVTFTDTGKTADIKLFAKSCRLEYPRDEPPMDPFTIRSFASEDGAWIGVYSSSGRPTSTISMRLGDDSSSATLIPAFRTSELASGRDVDLGRILLVRLDKKGQNGAVIPVKLVLRGFKPV